MIKRSILRWLFIFFIGVILAGVSLWLAHPVSADSLIGFNEGYGSTVHDTSGSASGTITNAVWKPADECISGPCLYFDGSGDFVSFGNESTFNFTAATNWTIELWFKTIPISSGSRVLIAKYVSGSGGGYKIYMSSDGKINFGVDDDSTWGPDDLITSISRYDDNTWHHVTASKTGTTNITLYIDALRVAQKNSLTATGTLASTANFYVGIDGDGSSNGWSGYIDEMKVVTAVARTNDQIKTDYQKGVTSHGTNVRIGPDTSNLTNGMVGYWKMDETVNGSARTDSSGNGNTLSDNNSVATASGKFANGAEFVPGSTQYLSASTGGSYEYYFNGSDESPSSSGVWSFAYNAYNSSTADGSSESQTVECNSNYITAGGTSAPTSGDAISSVEARFLGYGYDGIGAMLNTNIRTNGGAENLYSDYIFEETSETWTNYYTLNTPSGGWTWQKVNDLETESEVIGSGQPFMSCSGYLAYVQIRVNTASASINGIKTVSFWANPDNNTNYYLSLTSGAYITSSSGTLSATGFTNPKIYVNGVPSTTIAANTWSLVTVTSDTVINADQFYIGKQGSNYYDGTLDEVRLYNRALTPAEVSQLYNWAPGPVGYWKMDENSGSTVNDISGNGNYGTFTGQVSWASNCAYGSCIQTKIQDVADYVSVTHPASGILNFSNIQSFSIEAWVKTSATEGTSRFVHKGGTGLSDDGYMLYYLSASNRAGCRYTDGNGTGEDVVSGTTKDIKNDGKWHHIACVMDRSSPTFYLYIDGVVDDQDSSLGEGSAASDTGNFIIGDDTTTNEYNGGVDDVKIYNYARTTSQVIEDMNAGHPAPGSPVGSAYAWYKFDEGYGDTAYNSGSGESSINGDLYGACPGASTCPAWDNEGKFGKALRFDGGSDYVDLGTATLWSSTAPRTVSFWTKLDGYGLQSYPIVFIMKSNLTEGFRIFYSDVANYQGINFGDSGTYYLKGKTAGDISSSLVGVWKHVVLVYDGVSPTSLSSYKLYIDNQLQSLTTVSAGISAVPQNNYIGANPSGSYYFDGLIDDFRLYNSALTADQVKLLYNQGSAAVLGALSDTTGLGGGSVASNSASAAYCVPGDTSTCRPPVGEWKMDENTGATAYDTSGNGNNGPLGEGTAAYYPVWKPGKIGSGLRFDGVDDRIYIADNDLLSPPNDMTIEAWIYPEQLTAEKGVDIDLLSKRDTVGPPYYSWDLFITDEATHVDGLNFGWVRNNSPTYTLSNAYSYTSGGTLIQKNQWQHVVGVRQGASLKIYINGKDSTASSSPPGAGDVQVNSNSNMHIGRTSGNEFKGIIDDIHLYDYARTPAQIAWDMNRGAPYAWYRFDECQGSTAHDAASKADDSISRYDGTISIGGSGAQTTPGNCNTSGTAWYNGATGKYSASLNLDGNDDYVTTSAFSPLAAAGLTATKVSWGGWFKPDTTITSKTLIEKASEFRLVTDTSGNPTCGAFPFTSASAATVSAALSLSTWSLVTCTYDGSNISVFVNGARAAVKPYTNSITAASSILYLGESSGAAQRYQGQLDDVRLYNYSLTPAQIKVIYNNGAFAF